MPRAAGPTMRRHRSKQDYRTPKDFLIAVRKRLKIDNFTIDLAATKSNRICEAYVSPKDDALSLSWRLLIGSGWGWLNPPFNNIAPWAARCASTRRRIAFLTPASVGANWFLDSVAQDAFVLFLNGRLNFTDEPYPKDCMLSLYGTGRTGVEIWDWRNDERYPLT